MKTLAEEGIFASSACMLEATRGRGNPGRRLLLRLSSAMVAAAVAVLLILGTGAAQPARAQVESVIHSFPSPYAYPYAGLLRDSNGNLYGTTQEGGSHGLGTVFEEVYDPSTHSYSYNPLYSFAYGTGGNEPYLGTLVQDAEGNLYGTTQWGGSTSCYGGCGVVYELSPPSQVGDPWAYSVIFRFSGDGSSVMDGAKPSAGVTMGPNGNLYGTTYEGGGDINCSGGCGTVYELSPPTTGGTWAETVLYRFTYSGSTPDLGYNPEAGVAVDSNRNVYGATSTGGATPYAGTVFKLSPPATATGTWTPTLLHSFSGPFNGDGIMPWGTPILGPSGNLYGTAYLGGGGPCAPNGCGSVYDLTKASGYQTMAFQFGFNGSNGYEPYAGLIMGPNGNLYGTTYYAGSQSGGSGNVFKLSPPTTSGGSWTDTVLHKFTGKPDGKEPYGNVTMDPAGNLYGTTHLGGANDTGAVFGIAPVTLSASSLDLGSVPDGTKSSSKTVMITSYGKGALDFGSVSFSGANAADFSVGRDNCSGAQVAPNGSCSVSVSFTPTGTGTETASLNIMEGGITVAVNLTGTVLSPTATLSSNSLSFPDTLVGANSTAQTVTLTNTSSLALTISGIIASTNFTVDSSTTTCGSSLAASSSCTIGVIFSPTTAGNLTGTLTISDNTASGSETVNLSGTAVSVTAGLSTTTLSFPDTLVGASSTAQTVTITNTSSGSDTLNISNFGVSGTNFTVDSNTTTCTDSTSLAAKSSCDIGVIFSPTTTGTQSGTLTISDNTLSGSETVNLSGNGVQPTVSLLPTSLTFPDTLVGTTSTAQSVTLKNTNTNTAATLNISSITITAGSANFTKTSTTCGSNLAAGHSCTIGVAFSPTTTGSLTGTLTVSDNTLSGSETVNLSGTGVQPTATLSPDLTFPETLVGTTSTAQTVTLTNTSNNGAAMLNISSIAVSNANFTKTSTTCGSNLAAGHSCTIDVAFSPTAAGILSGTLTVSDNTSSGSQSVSLSGTGATTVGYVGTYMVSQVESLGLKNGQTNSLVKELDQAATMISEGKINGAINNLELFIAEVNDLLSSGKLTPAQAIGLSNLKAEATYVINTLE